MPNDQQRTPLTPTQAIQMNQIQAPMQHIDIKNEHQTQQKQTLQVVRPPNVINQPFIAQSLPPNNINVNPGVNVNVNMDQMATGAPIEDGLSNAGPSSQSTSSNQKTYERMRQDEGNYRTGPLFTAVDNLLILSFAFLSSA